MKAGIVNVTGYAGAELARLLACHPEVRLTQVTGRSAAGKPLGQVFPHLAPLGLAIQEDLDEVDVCFTALPHHASAELVPELLRRARWVIDISADYRLHDLATYERWYGHHPSPSLLPEAVYGLPELHWPAIARARLVANPGCYPTASILGLAPIIDAVEPQVIVDAKSGVSGAGRTMKLEVNHYCEVNENVQAYGLQGHRHQPEIAQELQEARNRAREHAADGVPLQVTFVPHLVPMTRGILATCYARLAQPLAQHQVMERYRAFYADQPFTRVVDAPPATKQTLGSNLCLVYPLVQEATGQVIVISCIDNLVKGAAGQAIHNMNLMLGLRPTAGLEGLAVYP
ncbi:MAG: N-acetyl-gamma-glutamyl-phosphate reductase [Chloroflexi bacterium]|nr:N-acetyl-gamma-glutamyl-phosphate reductase [Chloroflexota bacterium]